MARALIAIVLTMVTAAVAMGATISAVVLVGGLTAVGFSVVWRLTASHVGIAPRSVDRLDHP